MLPGNCSRGIPAIPSYFTSYFTARLCRREAGLRRVRPSGGTTVVEEHGADVIVATVEQMVGGRACRL